MLTFDFICISVPMTTERKAFLILLVEVSLSVVQLWLRSAHPGDGLSVAGGHQVDSRKCFFFLWTTLWGVHGAKAELKRFLQFSFFFFILFAERVRLWCFYVSAFAVLTELSPSHRVWIISLFIFQENIWLFRTFCHVVRSFGGGEWL